MKIVEGFKLRKVAGEMVVCGEGAAQINFNKLIALNESAAYLWQSVEGRDFSIDEMAQLLVSEYEIEQEVAEKDARAIAQSWMEVGIVE